MTEITTTDILKKLGRGEIVYLLDVCESDAAFKLIPQDNNTYATIVKFSGVPEYSVESNSNIAYKAHLCGKEITEEEYNKY